MKFILSLPFLIASVFLASCSNSDSENVTGSSNSTLPVKIVALTPPDSGLSSAKLGTATIAPHPLPERFPAAAAADALVITVGAKGLRPLDKEQISIAGLLQPSTTIVVLTDADTVGDGSADSNFDSGAWLKEKEKEVQEVGAMFGVKGLIVATDSADAEGDFATKGWEAVLTLAGKATPRTVPARKSSDSLKAVITLPKGTESPAPHALQSIKNGKKLDVVFPGGHSKTVFEVEATINTGTSSPAVLKLENPIEVTAGDKFVITRMGAIIGSGQISE
ncbi:MAG: hypothetical protein R3F19_33050 [Verrucomicrobiales bacterium]